MQNIPPLVRNIGVGVLLALLLFFGYQFTVNKNSSQTTGSLTETGPMMGSSTTATLTDGSIAIDQAYQHLTFLNKLDPQDIFNNPTLQSLVDYRVPLATSTLVAENIGRDNPFIPATAKKTPASK
ncbi:MAG: hypothetical protein ACYC8S_01945 [Minisyncoccota bacterium]